MSRTEKRIKKHQSVRKYIKGTSDRPRLAVFRSSQHIYAQIIDDIAGKTLAAASDVKAAYKGTRTEIAYEVGKELAEKAAQKGIKEVIFDRGGFLYHGRIAKLAEGARAGGLKF